ncbi:DNA replication and repair protein RecO [Alkalibaculum bacchi]|uniref:DNA repair protein RecO n=1 Tax=Alkalibaculum bacchi TaxID=645887 RepID=A0A366ID97_9FIRM|nr:DNA repair protein RecO [Alkalibaculum bacchi]RBP68908.1 DNA replication and repair protein RecO [Alkalibaculum bacchi]
MEKVSGVVIKRTDLSDNDVIVTIFTKEKGKIQAIAKGAKKPKSQYTGTTQLFCYSNFVYYPGKSLGYLSQSELIESFYKLRNSLEKLYSATYIIEMINATFLESEKDERILSLLLHTLSLLASDKTRDIRTVLLSFQLKFVGFLGYVPHLNHCSRCTKEYEEYYFSKKIGGLICPKCKGNSTFERKISRNGLEILKTILYYDITKISQLIFNEELMKYLIKLMNDYIVYHIDKKLYSFEFLETI